MTHSVALYQESSVTQDEEETAAGREEQEGAEQEKPAEPESTTSEPEAIKQSRARQPLLSSDSRLPFVAYF